MCRRVGMGMNVGIFCYGCLFRSKRMGATNGVFFWIDFDCAIGLSLVR